MKKGFIVLLLVLMVPFATKGQENPYFGAGKMVPSAGIGWSGYGLGFGAGFEYGVTDAIGVYPSYMSHSYEDGLFDWSFNVFDVWATYHDKSINSWFGNNEKVDAYYMAGITFSSFSYEYAGSSLLFKDSDDTSIGFGVGAGGRYHFDDKLAFQGEARYRFVTYKAGGVSAGGVFYAIHLGASYALN